MRGAARAARGLAGQLRARPPAPGPGPPPPPAPPAAPAAPLLLAALLAVLLGGAGAQYSSDLCSWKGSGLTHEAHRKEVEQVYLRCSAGSVEWMYPTGALIVNVRPNTFPPSRHLTLCIKPLKDSSGANIYLEKTGELKLLVRDGDRGPGQVRCFGFEQGGLFVEAAPQQDISRRTTGFQYELTSRHAESDLHTLSAPCRPCSDAEVLLAVCTSDFGESSRGLGDLPGGGELGEEPAEDPWGRSAPRCHSYRKPQPSDVCLPGWGGREWKLGEGGHPAGAAAEHCPPGTDARRTRARPHRVPVGSTAGALAWGGRGSRRWGWTGAERPQPRGPFGHQPGPGCGPACVPGLLSSSCPLCSGPTGRGAAPGVVHLPRLLVPS
uniref:Meteorin-like protein n=1 Tax=Canis lupus familiaris TaxID=9615 RepID=A0A8C0P1X0_CANLF